MTKSSAQGICAPLRADYGDKYMVYPASPAGLVLRSRLVVGNATVLASAFLGTNVNPLDPTDALALTIQKKNLTDRRTEGAASNDWRSGS